MTVRELWEALRRCNPDAPVHMDDGSGSVLVVRVEPTDSGQDVVLLAEDEQ